MKERGYLNIEKEYDKNRKLREELLIYILIITSINISLYTSDKDRNID